MVDANQAAIFGGSFWQYEYNTDEAKTDEHCRVRVNCHSVPGIWQYEALAFKPGMVMRWYRDAFCQYEKELSKTTGRDPYDLMNEKAKDIPAGCYGMMCAFSDVMNYISWRHASPMFINFDFDPDKFNRYTFYRAIMENTAMVICSSSANPPATFRRRLCSPAARPRASSGARFSATCWAFR